jgi:hypothetical protein
VKNGKALENIKLISIGSNPIDTNLLKTTKPDLSRAAEAVSIRIVSAVSASQSAAEAVKKKKIGCLCRVECHSKIQRFRPVSR